MTRQEAIRKINAASDGTKGSRNAVACAILGHSLVSTQCFGYRYCARCEAQTGDNLASIDTLAEKRVFLGHNCPTCRKNYRALDWKHKLYSPNPFKEGK